MDLQDHADGGTDDDVRNEPQSMTEANKDRISPDDRDQEKDGERSECRAVQDHVREGANQPEPYAATEKDVEESRAEEAQLGTDIQQSIGKKGRHPTFIDNDRQSSRGRNNLDQLHKGPLPGPNQSLEHLQRSSQAWQNVEVTEAAQVPLPSSEASSVLSTHGPAEAPLPFGKSLENLELRPETIPLPSRKKANPFLTWMTGSATTKSRKKSRKKQEATTAPPSIADEVENYRNNVNRLADHFAYFNNVATTDTRHHWSSQIVLFDRLESEHHQSPKRHEPWPDQTSAPSYFEFYSTLRTVADNCEQRLVLVEDLNPSLVDLLGATFDIPPHVFVEHLDRSGYKNTVETHKSASAWNSRSSAQGYSCVTWYRPVLPLLSLSSRLRARLIKNRSPQVPCPLEGCEQHKIPLGTTGNIWRHYIELCPEPGDYHKGSETEYPVGWEERATLWSRDFDGCKFVVLLLDPLPVVMVKQKRIGPLRQERLIPMGNHWISKEEGVYIERRSRPSRDLRSQQYVFDWLDQHLSAMHPEGWPPAPAFPTHARSGPNPTDKSHPQTTGTDLDPAGIDFPVAALRRRATKPDMERALTGAFDVSSTLPGNSRRKTQTFNEHATRTTAPPSMPPPPTLPPTVGPMPHGLALVPKHPLPYPALLSNRADQESVTDRDHGPFVPYDLIKARSSLSARNDATFVTKHMRTYIESLQIPKSTLEELDEFLQAPSKGKETQYDPFQALFRAIHDDSHALVDIIRISLQRIREGTLDEDLMQRRVNFWRTLLHRLHFKLSVLDQKLRAFVQFINEPETHTSRALLPSEKLAEETRVSLRSCMDLIDKSSHSLLAEMQIVDSRRSIAEAESVSKLTELAFVFIPLSFVASLFSMQIHEFDGGVPLYQFALVAIGFVIVAYAVRLSIRSSHLIEYKNNIFSRIREETELQHNERIPTHKFLGWFSSVLGATISKNTKTFISVFAPFTLVLAVIAAVLSPIVLLWLRKMDIGFTAVMTVLLLLLDIMLLLPIDFNPLEGIREVKQAHKMNRKRREKAKTWRKRKAGEDPEQAGSDSTRSNEDITM